MADPKPILKRPPGYKDPNAPMPTPNVPQQQPQQQQQQQQQQPPSIRKHQIPPMYHPKPKRKRNCCRCCCCIFCTLLFLVILFLLVAGAIFYIWFEPKLPNYHLESLKFSTFKVSVTPDGTFLDAQTDVRFEVTNPNTKIDILYDKTEVQLTIGGNDDVDIGSASIPAFNQGKRNITILKFASGVKHLLIDDEIGGKLKKQIISKQMLVTIEVRTKVGLSLEGWKIGKMPVRVLCENMSLNKLDGGGNPKCVINILKWINI